MSTDNFYKHTFLIGTMSILTFPKFIHNNTGKWNQQQQLGEAKGCHVEMPIP